MNLSEKVKLQASLHGITMKEVAARMPNERNKEKPIGIYPANLSVMLRGNITITKLEQLASIIGCKVGDFFVDKVSESFVKERCGRNPSLTCPKCGAEISVDVELKLR